MIKILIIFAIVILSALLGVALSNIKKRKFVIVSELYEFNESLILNLKYERKKFNEILKDFPYAQRFMNGEMLLGDENDEFIAKYISGIGTTDSQAQMTYLSEMKERLLKLKQEYEFTYKKYGSLYIKLSILCGIVVAVILA